MSLLRRTLLQLTTYWHYDYTGSYCGNFALESYSVSRNEEKTQTISLDLAFQISRRQVTQCHENQDECTLQADQPELQPF
jgi:hypothetical protein